MTRKEKAELYAWNQVAYFNGKKLGTAQVYRIAKFAFIAGYEAAKQEGRREKKREKR